MTLISSSKLGRFTAAKQDLYLAPTRGQDKPLVILCHGAGGVSANWNGHSGFNAMLKIGHAIARAGWCCVAPSIENLWGNTTSDTRIGSAKTWGQANLPCAAGDIALFGASMGADSALSWAYDNIADVLCVGGVIPALDLQAIRVANTLSLRAPIDTAWGVSYPTALPAGANPASNTSTLDDVPQWFSYANDDAVSANIATYATATGATIDDIGALGHTEAAMLATDLDAMIDFLTLYAS